MTRKGPSTRRRQADRKRPGDGPASAARRPPAALLEPYGRTRDAIAAWRDQWRVARGGGRPIASRPRRPAPRLAVPPGLPGEFEDYLRGAIAYHQGKPDAAPAPPGRSCWPARAGERRLPLHLGRLHARQGEPGGGPRRRRPRVRAHPRARGPGLPRSPGPRRSQPRLAGPGRDEPQAARRGPEALSPAAEGRRPHRRAFDPPRLPQGAGRSGGPDTGGPLARGAADLHRLGALRVGPRGLRGPLDPEPARKWLAAVSAAGVAKSRGRRPPGLGRLPGRRLRRRRASGCGGRRPTLPWRAGSAPSSCCAPASWPRPSRSSPRPPPRCPRAPDPDDELWRPTRTRSSPPCAPAPRASSAPSASPGASTGRSRRPAARRLLDRRGLRGRAGAHRSTSCAPTSTRPGPPRSPPVQPGRSRRTTTAWDAWEHLFAGLASPPDERHRLRPALSPRSPPGAGRPLAEPGPYLPASLEAGAGRSRQRSLAGAATAARPAAGAGPQTSSAPPASPATREWSCWAPSSSPTGSSTADAYELDSFAEARADPKTHRHLGPTPDERQRVARSRAEPDKRFHYRYQGMDLAREAAKLLPGGTEERARLLATAGNWVEGTRSQGARPLYDAIQSCCADTEIARRSRKVNAITNVEDACPADTEPRSGEEEN